MPELPEVETVVRGLSPRLVGRRIENIEVISRRIPRRGIGAALGQRIRAVRRHGKYILIELETGLLVVHLRMTGRFRFGGEAGAYTRVVVSLDSETLHFEDIRQFGTFQYCRELPPELTALGPDALEIAQPEFAVRLCARNRQIKPLLLDQTFLRGLGNIYVDEALFAARIHPRAMASSVSAKRAVALHRAITAVLLEAIERGGSSISDFVDPYGRQGSYSVQHQVYGRDGEPCPRCGKCLIVREVVAQRGTHFCPRCQSSSSG
jgi:formamidopyrimidine-DNA glycosylase